MPTFVLFHPCKNWRVGDIFNQNPEHNLQYDVVGVCSVSYEMWCLVKKNNRKIESF